MPAKSIAGLASLPERVRAFIALRLDAAVDDAIAELIERLRAPENSIAQDDTRERGIRWARRANFHLTLFFLGSAVARERLAPIAHALETMATATAPFEVAARGVGAFPNPARPRVIFVALHGDALASLAACVAEAAERCGFAPERRAYSPHLTIGRVRSLKVSGRLRRTLSREADSNFGVSRIEHVSLYRSEPGPQSSTYHELAAFALGAGEHG
jgi:RNA 2',3'-cyclic 3'-phosphodiesterase